MKALHFGMAFNPRPATTATATATAARATRSRPAPAPSPSSVGEGAEVGWAKFLAKTLEEIVFGDHFNQPVVSRIGETWRGGGTERRRMGATHNG